jgi:NADPH-dependent 2,4-dienoyl-CoA reductase/sulfur reductase-like enzyme
MKIVVIGGVAAGMSAAAKARREDKNAEIIVYEKGGFLSYAACGMPYYIGNENQSYEELIIRTQEKFKESGIMAHLYHEVVSVDSKAQEVKVHDLKKDEFFTTTYDKLMIATGAHAIMLPIEGNQLENISPLKTLDHGIDIKERIMDKSVEEITIVGGGYIGIEIAENLVELGKKVRIIELLDRILLPFDEEISSHAHNALVEAGVDIKLKEKVLRLKDRNGDGIVDYVETDQGGYNTDFVVMAVGIKPNTEFLKGSGIELSDNGAVVVDQQMRTNVDHIYAAGDCAQVYHFQKKKNVYQPLATVANKCGKMVGVNMTGGSEVFAGAIGSAALKVLNLELARVGLSKEEAIESGYAAEEKIIKTTDHPKYYKTQHQIVFKAIYDKNTYKILGVQGVGEAGVVMRVNMFAVAIFAGMTAEDYSMIDLCYAPPFSGSWDATHIVTNVIK